MRQTASGTRQTTRSRGFTLVELLVVILVVFALMGLLLGGIHLVHKNVTATVDRATLNSLKQAETQFKLQFGTYTPLVKDAGDPPSFSASQMPVLNNKPRVYSEGADSVFLRTRPLNSGLPSNSDIDMRFSSFSLPIYILGSLDAPVDGVAGPGMRSVKRDGSFETAGRIFQPFYDVSRHANAVFQIDLANGKVVLRDRGEIPFRLYHWQHGHVGGPSDGQVITIDDLNVPRIVGDPTVDVRLKDVTWALVAAGPDGVFGDDDQLQGKNPQLGMSQSAICARLGINPSAAGLDALIWAKATPDNIVELLP